MGCGQVAGYALVVAGHGEGLYGIDHDVQAMAEMLRSRGFKVDIRTGDRATRRGILTGYDELRAKVAPGQPAVVYYTGHGWYAFESNEAVPWQGICPTDIDEPSEFCGITGWELSIKQKQLTDQTQNVTVILDCCHAAQMSRDAAADGAICRALPHPARVGFKAHFAALEAEYGEGFQALHSSGNPYAVRLVACSQDGAAFECPFDGQYRGVFTKAVLDVLHEVGDEPLSWAALDDAIRERVHRRYLIQRPDIEGPAERVPFSLAPGRFTSIATIEDRQPGYRIGAGQLMQVARGDVYDVMPEGSLIYSEGQAIARVRVTEPSATYSAAELCEWSNGHRAFPVGAVAIPFEKHFVRRPVRVVAQESTRAIIDEAIKATRLLRPAAPEEASALPELRVSCCVLTIADELGPLFHPAQFPEQLPAAIKHLSNLAAAQALRDLAGEHGVCANEVEIEWGSVVRASARKMPASGGMLALRDKIYVRVTSRAERELYVHIVNIGLGGRTTLATANRAPGGFPLLTAGSRFTFGEGSDGKLAGIGLGWPAAVARDAYPRLDQILVIVTSTPVSLRGLETRDQDVGARGFGSALQDLLSQVQDGLPRSLAGTQSVDGHYMRLFSYYLCPQEASIADVKFEIDDDPLRRLLVSDREAWIAPVQDSTPAPDRSGAVTIRLAELEVADPVVLSRMRIDALVVTRSVNGAGFATWTWRHPVAMAVAEGGARSSANDKVIFQGQLNEFVEVCLWASADRDGSLTLEELLAQHPDRAVIDDATRALSLISCAPRVRAVAASAALARISDDLLVAATEHCSGTFRCSFDWRTVFGSGRIPAIGSHHAREFSFALSIVPGGELTKD